MRVVPEAVVIAPLAEAAAAEVRLRISEDIARRPVF